jgi:hypothetical protein
MSDATEGVCGGGEADERVRGEGSEDEEVVCNRCEWPPGEMRPKLP